jgi:hypothetical protein
MITKFMRQLKNKSIVDWPITNLFVIKPLFLIDFGPDATIDGALVFIVDLFRESKNVREITYLYLHIGPDGCL